MGGGSNIPRMRTRGAYPRRCLGLGRGEKGETLKPWAGIWQIGKFIITLKIVV